MGSDLCKVRATGAGLDFAAFCNDVYIIVVIIFALIFIRRVRCDDCAKKYFAMHRVVLFICFFMFVVICVMRSRRPNFNHPYGFMFAWPTAMPCITDYMVVLYPLILRKIAKIRGISRFFSIKRILNSIKIVQNNDVFRLLWLVWLSVTWVGRA